MEVPLIGQLISQARNQLRMVNADMKVSKRFIWSIIDKHARWLIKRESSKLKLMKMDYLFQTLKCVDVIEVPSSDECCGIKTKCKIWRTREKVPQVYTDEDGVIFKAVYSVDGSEEFIPIKLQEFMRKTENPHSKYDKGRYYYYNNGYLYFPNSHIKMVQVKGYFMDEIINECRPEDHIKKCMSNMDKRLRIPDYLVAEMMEHVVNDLINLRKIPADVRIDKNEDKPQ